MWSFLFFLRQLHAWDSNEGQISAAETVIPMVLTSEHAHSRVNEEQDKHPLSNI